MLPLQCIRRNFSGQRYVVIRSPKSNVGHQEPGSILTFPELCRALSRAHHPGSCAPNAPLWGRLDSAREEGFWGLETNKPRISAGFFVLMGARGFEPLKAEPADLQSAPFGHLGTRPYAGLRLRDSIVDRPGGVQETGRAVPLNRHLRDRRRQRVLRPRWQPGNRIPQ
jgi:hypothetical protein